MFFYLRNYLIIFLIYLLPLKSHANLIKDGYTDKISYFQGDIVTIYINALTTLPKVGLKIANANNEVVDSVTALVYPQLITHTNPWENGFGYKPTVFYKIPASLKSGFYNIENRIFFIVKNRKKQADIVVVYPTNTEEAYNYAGGKCLYDYHSIDGKKVSVVSFLRPLSNRVIDSVRFYARGFLKWTARASINNYSISLISDMDMDDYSEIENAKLVVIIGHSEYWTRAARLNLDNFVNSGKDAVILSGNTMWWQVRYSPDKTKLICYKDFSDPVSNPLLKTINWSEPSLKYSPEESIGVDFGQNGGYGLHKDKGWNGYKILAPNSPLLQGTGLKKGDILPMPSYECDGTIIKGKDEKGNPIANIDSLKYCSFELIGFDSISCQYKTCSNVSTFIAFQKNSGSGRVVNTASSDWCSEACNFTAGETGGIGGKDSLIIRKITENIFIKLISKAEIFSNAGTQYCHTTLSAATAWSNENCFGDNNGMASVFPHGGISPYAYHWSNGATANSIQDLPAGEYVVTVSDAAKIPIITKITISEPLALSADITVTPAISGNYGSASVIVSGGTPPYSYLWSIDPFNPATSTVDSLSEGIYNVTISDAGSCELSQSFKINAPSEMLLYPNPANNMVSFYYHIGDDHYGRLIIFSMEGNIIQSYPLNDDGSNLNFSIQHFQPGLYFYAVETDGVIGKKGKFIIFK